MPVPAYPEFKPWTLPKETQTELDYAPLAVLDFAKWDLPGGKQELACELRDAVRTMGFWAIKNPGVSQAEMDRMFAFANTFFDLPEEQKMEVTIVDGKTVFQGYRPPGIVKGTTHKENFEILALRRFYRGCTNQRHGFVKHYQETITAFQNLVHEKVIVRLFTLLSIILELPLNHFLDMHKLDKESDSHLRYIKYHARTTEQDKAVNNQWLSGHTDFGTITLLFPQPVAGLQVLTSENEWKWVKYVEGGIICNAADVLSMMTKGYVKSAVHRVTRPPPDQTHLTRLGMFFFLRPADDVPMKPSFSPVLQREGLWTAEDDAHDQDDTTTCGEFVIARLKNYNPSRQPDRKENEVLRFKNWQVQNKY
ncbi:hypothetical protein GGX14DRAFT_475175 [Mycena pura]|uniref:Clavaminate synthase-like protein n=1 Tax=Mycena pura TaxID=153505 RepID=A0AAD6UVE7_9AGAR|nr:hypothetical protein GGX14DRAFT_475175 [Mycena pura]